MVLHHDPFLEDQEYLDALEEQQHGDSDSDEDFFCEKEQHTSVGPMVLENEEVITAMLIDGTVLVERKS